MNRRQFGTMVVGSCAGACAGACAGLARSAGSCQAKTGDGWRTLIVDRPCKNHVGNVSSIYGGTTQPWLASVNKLADMPLSSGGTIRTFGQRIWSGGADTLDEAKALCEAKLREVGEDI